MNQHIRERLRSRGPLLLVPDAVLLPEGVMELYAVVVSAGSFEAVGPTEELERAYPRLQALRLPGHLLMPGFVDSHHHLTQSFGAALAFGEPSEIFRRVWVPLEGALDEESAYVAAKLAALESLRGGCTTVTDAGTRAAVDTDVVACAARDAGIRCVLGLICDDTGPGADADPSVVLRRAERHLATYTDDPLIHPSLAISIPEAATPATLSATGRLAAEARAVLQMHVNEHLAAVERSLLRHGARPLEYLAGIDALGPHLLAAHTTLLTPREVSLLADTGTAVSYNPVASAWKGNAVAPATTLAERGVRFGIGSDGTRGDGFRLVEAAEFAQRLAYGLTTGDSSCGAGWTWLEHATAGGADAVGVGGHTGGIAAGMAADFLLVDISTPELALSWDLPWELVRRGNRDQISAVFVAGRLRLWHGQPTDWDGPGLVRRATALARTAVARAPVTRAHPTSTTARRTAVQEPAAHRSGARTSPAPASTVRISTARNRSTAQ
ncbi:amidohydrolase family protein [Streptomyces sp. ASQP_92]|uniref:amidohydrolase family protein n=1 Tax=Streptomyces sp. ASQP_92 TaxID=2979116 RepID=UPI0021C24245|nr:amidohydrolase family protein [Streptomyces sp. ASQP_92]MCT9093588.1 amidohydrolase family protein [Streptomyces sp. ASQP_92]